MEEQPESASLVDELPEPMTCGRRGDTFARGSGEVGKDRWQKFKSVGTLNHGNRVCSYCGSLHPDDLFALVKTCAEAPEDAKYGSVVEIEPSDKGYKIYVHQPGVRNAMEGGIKFYTQHLPRDASGAIDISPERNDEYKRARRATNIRFERHLAMMRPAKTV